MNEEPIKEEVEEEKEGAVVEEQEVIEGQEVVEGQEMVEEQEEVEEGEVVEERVTSKRDERFYKLLLVGILFISYAYFFQGGTGNTAPQFCLIRAVLERGTLYIEGYPTGADIIQIGRHLYSNKVPGNAIFGFVPFTVFSYLLPIFQLPVWLVEHLLIYLTTLFTASLYTVLNALMLYVLLLRMTSDRAAALMTAFCYGLGTIAFPFGTLFFSHQLSSFLVFFSFYLLFTYPTRAVLLVLAGFAAGFAVATDYPSALMGLLLTVYAVFRLPQKLKLLWFILGGILGGCVLMAYNWVAFQEPFFITYKAYAAADRSAFPEHKAGFVGVSYPRPKVLWRITFHPQRGLFYFNPLLLLALPGLFFLWKRREYRREWGLVLAALVVFLAFNASYGDSIVFWGGGASTGPRHVIPMIPFAMVAVGFLLHRFKLAFYLFFPVSFFLMLMATAVDPILRYEFIKPIQEFLLPYFLRGDLAINQEGTFNPQFITENSVAFNLGQLLGFPGSLSLFPLMVIWFVGFWIILNRLRKEGLVGPKNRNGLRAGGAVVLMSLIMVPLFYQIQEQEFTIASGGNGLVGYYYTGTKWEGNPALIRKDATINLQWPGSDIPLKNPFSIRWQGKIVLPEAGVYVFYTDSDDGSWVYIDNKLVVDNSGEHGPRIRQGRMRLNKGEHQLKIEYFNSAFTGVMRFLWKPPGRIREVVPSRYLRQR